MELEEAIEKTKALLNLNDIFFEETGTHLYLGKQEKELIQILLNHLTKQEKMIKLMIDKLDQYYYENYCYDEFWQYEPEMCNNRDCKQCIKQYFEKKAEESE